MFTNIVFFLRGEKSEFKKTLIKTKLSKRMKHILTIVALLCITITNAQITFEKGYYINNSDEKVEGFIKNIDWKNNPTSFEFKASLSSDPITLSIKNVSEFSVLNSSKFERHKVKIDRSPNGLDQLGYKREPDFKDETLFIKVLVENEAVLYRYTDMNLTTFFYKKDGSLYTLVHKRYFDVNNDLNENNFYQQQIASNLSCSNNKMPNPENIKYTATSLTKYFKAYGNCTGTSSNTIIEKTYENSFNVKVIAGVQTTSFSVDSNTRRTADFGSNVGFVPGIELEYLLPFNAQKWALFLDVRYQSYEAENANGIISSTLNPTVIGFDKASYSGVDTSIGFRHYFLINSTSKIHLGLNYAIDFITDTEVIYEDAQDLITSTATGVLGISAGYTFDKFTAEIRYHTNRNSLGNEFLFNQSDYSNLTFSLAYRFASF